MTSIKTYFAAQRTVHFSNSLHADPMLAIPNTDP